MPTFVSLCLLDLYFFTSKLETLEELANVSFQYFTVLGFDTK